MNNYMSLLDFIIKILYNKDTERSRLKKGKIMILLFLFISVILAIKLFSLIISGITAAVGESVESVKDTFNIKKCWDGPGKQGGNIISYSMLIIMWVSFYFSAIDKSMGGYIKFAIGSAILCIIGYVAGRSNMFVTIYMVFIGIITGIMLSTRFYGPIFQNGGSISNKVTYIVLAYIIVMIAIARYVKRGNRETLDRIKLRERLRYENETFR